MKWRPVTYATPPPSSPRRERYGRCEKPGCSCAKATAGRSKQLGFKMCQCGHVFDAHVLVVGGSKADQDQPPGKQQPNKAGWVLPQKKVRGACMVLILVCFFPLYLLVKQFGVAGRAIVWLGLAWGAFITSRRTRERLRTAFELMC